LKNITNYGILYRRKDNVDLEVLMDVDWASNLKLKRSINGYIFKIRNSPMASGNGNRQAIVTLSLAEAKYHALMEGTKEVV